MTIKLTFLLLPCYLINILGVTNQYSLYLLRGLPVALFFSLSCVPILPSGFLFFPYIHAFGISIHKHLRKKAFNILPFIRFLLQFFLHNSFIKLRNFLSIMTLPRFLSFQILNLSNPVSAFIQIVMGFFSSSVYVLNYIY